ncbi:uncharacterized protein DS421_20g702130 [Arachis hypogaea]|nr:uncharacterized protein DS421_20g702130 [Arachis hypogaea]
MAQVGFTGSKPVLLDHSISSIPFFISGSFYNCVWLLRRTPFKFSLSLSLSIKSSSSLQVSM